MVAALQGGEGTAGIGGSVAEPGQLPGIVIRLATIPNDQDGNVTGHCKARRQRSNGFEHDSPSLLDNVDIVSARIYSFVLWQTRNS